MTIKLIIKDEINCKFVGLLQSDIKTIVQKTELMVDGARHTSLYIIGAWNGKSSNFLNDGSTFIYMLDDVLPIVMDDLGYEVEIEDKRKTISFFPTNIDNTYIKSSGITLRGYQVDSVNEIIAYNKGIINVATAGGKSNICVSTSKVYDKHYRSIIITNSEKLVEQLYQDYINNGLDVGKIHSKISDKKKDEFWKKRHVITTWQSLGRQKKRLKSFDVVLYDEVHIMGDSMFGVLSNELANCHIRVGFTGTVPKKKYKRQKIFAHLGGEVLRVVTAKELQDSGYIATIDIDVIKVRHQIVLPDDEWSTEYKYLTTNKHRINTIADFIRPKLKNSGGILILCYPELGLRLSEILGLDFIDKDVSGTVRETYYKKFDTEVDYSLIATFGTAGTGVSIDQIRTMFLIDAGKNDTRILQGIGRGLRLDGLDDHLKLWDLYAETVKTNPETGNLNKYGFSSTKHKNDRFKIYKKEHYDYVIGSTINVSTG